MNKNKVETLADILAEDEKTENIKLTPDEIDKITEATFKASGNVPCDYVIAGAKAQLAKVWRVRNEVSDNIC